MAQLENAETRLKAHFPDLPIRATEDGLKINVNELGEDDLLLLTGLFHSSLVDDIKVKRSGTGLVVLLS